MPFTLHFGEADPLRCRFALSPLWETQEAVRTLARPERHGYHLPWLRRLRGARTAGDLDFTPLQILMPHRGHNPDCLYPPPIGPAATFDEEIARVRATDPESARDDLAQALADAGTSDRPEARAMLADPARAIGELADLIEHAWRTLIAPDWPRLRALLEADIAYHSRRLADVGLEGMLRELHPRLEWDGTSTLTLDKTGDHRRDLGGAGLVLMPSVFSWPDVISGFDPPWQPTLVYPARGIAGLWAPPSTRTPETLARLLGRVRAEVLRALDDPTGTTALAHRLGLAPSSVSAHLSVLRDAGLLRSRRYGHQVLYERTPLGIALAAEQPGP
ncbi:DUF5937 family protein [Streptomyces sp. NPDC127084]|uniref:ArsR/SmtB family transcription factor n=1 Tax=Streptomyces sp. NPDC127084 TaxID=3347133 RepID=UPI00365CF862